MGVCICGVVEFEWEFLELVTTLSHDNIHHVI